MPKLGMEPIRRRQLINATVASIHRHGFAETTVSRICAEAGVSTGIVHHYFDGKDDLLAETMRSLLDDLRSSVAGRLTGVTDARRRIGAIIDGNFAADQFAPQAVSAWLAFWAQVPHSPALARLQRINARRLQSNLRHAFRQILPAASARSAAQGLGALIDGLWLQGALTPGGIGADEARGLAIAYVGSLLDEGKPA